MALMITKGGMNTNRMRPVIILQPMPYRMIDAHSDAIVHPARGHIHEHGQTKVGHEHAELGLSNSEGLLQRDHK